MDRNKDRQTRLQAALSASNKRDLFFSLVNPHLNRLQHFVTHILRYSEAMGDLVPGELAPQDVVDAALMRAYLEFVGRRAIHDIPKWLRRVALDELDEQVMRLKTERETSPERVA